MRHIRNYGTLILVLTTLGVRHLPAQPVGPAPRFAPPELRVVNSLVSPGWSEPGSAMAVMDIDKNRVPDLLTIGPAQLATLRGDGSGQFSIDRQSVFPGIPLGAFAGRMIIADIDLDGVDDQAGVSVVYGSTTAPYWSPPPQLLPSQFQVLGVGDANGDSLPDLFGVTPTGQAGCLLNLGGRNFATTFTIVGTPSHTAQAPPLGAGAVADINHDGWPDFALCDSWLDVYMSTGPMAWTRIPVSPLVSSAGYRYLIEVADFDGDGWHDIAAMGSIQFVNFPSAFRVFASVPGGTWQFTPRPEVLIPVHPSFSIGSCAAVQNFPENPAWVSADFNLDGHRDIAYLRNGEERVRFFYGIGGAAFSSDPASTVVLPLNTCSHHLVTADFDLDGRPDLASGIIGAQVFGTYYYHRNTTPLAASAISLGAGAQGVFGFPPTLGVRSLPFQGRSDFGISLHAGMPSTVAWLLLSPTPVTLSLPGSACVAYLDVTSALWPFPGIPLPTDATGYGFLNFDLGGVTGAAGVQLRAQCWMWNLVAPAFVATSDALDLTIG